MISSSGPKREVNVKDAQEYQEIDHVSYTNEMHFN